jgi:hypothetical protein
MAFYQRTATGLAPEIVTFSRGGVGGRGGRGGKAGGASAASPSSSFSSSGAATPPAAAAAPAVPGQEFAPNADARFSLLRPEALESAFLLARLLDEANAAAPPGDRSAGDRAAALREWSWGVLDSLELHARVRRGGFASVADVDVAGLSPLLPSAGRSNQRDAKMESFVLAETFKYLYLLHAGWPPGAEAAALLPRAEWVLNTEAHPLRVPARPQSEWAAQAAAPQRLQEDEAPLP